MGAPWWSRLPLDGEGLFREQRGEMSELRRWAAEEWWRGQGWERRRWWLRPAGQAAWAAGAALGVGRLARRQRLGWREGANLYRDCLRSGAQPGEAFLWMQKRCGESLYPLPARAGGALFRRLGDAEEQSVLADKEAAERVLGAAGIPLPRTLAIVRQGTEPEEGAAVWREAAGLFVKPRRGRGGRGAGPMDVLAGGRYGWGEGEPEAWGTIAKRLTAAASHDDLLVQERITVAPELRDLTLEGRAPVLRLTTARERGAEAFLHSALLVVAVAGKNPRDFLHGQRFLPVDGRGECEEGRRLTGWEEAVALGLRAMTQFPRLPLVTWDVIPGEGGPVFLEGNTAANWFLTTLPERAGLAAPLEPLLRRWAWGEGC